jgi:CRP-like cAMP-binding protein
MLQSTEGAAACAPARATRNKILQSLSPANFDRLKPHLKPVSFKKNEIIHRSNTPARGIYFIESGVVARTTPSGTIAPFEVAMAGKSGVIGLSAVLGGATVLHQTSAVIPVSALKIERDEIAHILADQASLRQALLRNVHLLNIQMAHLSLCNALHPIETRLPRWLMMAADRSTGAIPVTQDLVASLLAVRRPGVTNELRKLNEGGIIAKSRGAIQILDQEKLSSRTCVCYGLIRDSENRFGPFHADWSSGD